VHLAKATLRSRLHSVLAVGEVGVDGAADKLRVKCLELGAFVIELADLGWADEGEVEWPEEKHGVLSFELVKGHLLELTIPPSCG